MIDCIEAFVAKKQSKSLNSILAFVAPHLLVFTHSLLVVVAHCSICNLHD